MSKGYLMIADGLKMVAAGYEALAEIDAVPAKKATKKNTPKKEEPVPKEKSVFDTPQEQEETPIDKDALLVEIRAIMRQKGKEKKMDLCQALLYEYGVSKLSDVPEYKLSELKSKAEVL